MKGILDLIKAIENPFPVFLGDTQPLIQYRYQRLPIFFLGYDLDSSSFRGVNHCIIQQDDQHPHQLLRIYSPGSHFPRYGNIEAVAATLTPHFTHSSFQQRLKPDFVSCQHEAPSFDAGDIEQFFNQHIQTVRALTYDGKVLLPSVFAQPGAVVPECQCITFHQGNRVPEFM